MEEQAPPARDHPHLPVLAQGFEKILNAVYRNQSITRAEWMEYYKKSYDLCMTSDRREEELYQLIKDSLEKQINFITEKLQDLQDEHLLKGYIEAFGIFNSASKAINNTTNILTRFWLPAQKTAKKDVIEVPQLATKMWREKCYTTVKTSLLDALFNYIRRDRDSPGLDKTIVRSMTENLVAVGLTDARNIYQNDFEQRYLEETEAYYLHESSGMVGTNSISTYMARAEECIKQETTNCDSYYAQFKETNSKLKEVLDKCWVEIHMEALQNAFQEMLLADKHHDMTSFYFLLSRVPNGLTNSSNTFEELISAQGLVIVKEQQAQKTPHAATKSANSFVQRLMELYRKYFAQVEDCFLKSPLFKSSLDKAFVTIMNESTGKFTSSRLLSYYLDNLLKGKIKATEEVLNNQIEEIARLFAYFRDKDEFAEYARRSLCKRLLARGPAFNESAEKHFIFLLKEQCGNPFTRRLQGMFVDAEDESTTRIKDYFQSWNNDSDKVNGVQLSVQVLNESYWPISASEKFPIPGQPSEFVTCISKFEEFYKQTAAGKKLRWLYNYGTVQLTTTVAKSKRELVVTPLQGAVLLLFNQKDSWSIGEIVSALWPGERNMVPKIRSSRAGLLDINFPEILKAALHPLIFWECTALKMTPGATCTSGQETDEEGQVKLNDSDTLTVSVDLKKKRRVKFPVGSAKQESEQAQIDRASVMKVRGFEVDAAMVRVMKARNVLSWNELQTQVVDILKVRFRPPPKLLKAQLESLIERSFIERDTEDRALLKYIA